MVEEIRHPGQSSRPGADLTETILAMVTQAHDRGQLLPGSVYQLHVYHDPWCALLVAGGPCDCEPEVGLPERVEECES